MKHCQNYEKYSVNGRQWNNTALCKTVTTRYKSQVCTIVDGPCMTQSSEADLMFLVCVVIGCYGTVHPWICSLKFFIHCSLSVVCMTADAHPHPNNCCMRKCKACDAVCNRREDDLHKKHPVYTYWNKKKYYKVNCRHTWQTTLSFDKILSVVMEKWSRVFLPVAFLHHDLTGALSSQCGWFPGRHLTLPLCAPSPPVIWEEAKKRLHWKLHPCLRYNLAGPS